MPASVSPGSRILLGMLTALVLLVSLLWLAERRSSQGSDQRETDGEPKTITPSRSSETPATLRSADPWRGTVDVSVSEPEVRAERGIADTRVHVTDAETCRPIAGVQVFAASGMGKVLGSCFSDEGGIARGLPPRERIYGVVGWHPDYQLCGGVAQDSHIELQMRRLRHLRVKIDTGHTVAREWLDSCELTIHYEVETPSNPVRRGIEFLTHRVFKHLGLDIREWPVKVPGTSLPRYLNQPGRLWLATKPTLPARMAITRSRTTMSHAPDALATWDAIAASRKSRTGRSTKHRGELIAADVEEFTIVPDPKSPHALVARHVRQPRDTGEVWLHLAKSGQRVASHDYSTWQAHDGLSTFKVFGLEKAEYIPTLVFVVDKRVVLDLVCRPIAVDGRTEVALIPRDPAQIGGRITGPSGPTNTVHVCIRHANSKLARYTTAVDGQFEFPRLSPGKYVIWARNDEWISRLQSIELVEADRRKVDLEVLPICSLTIIASRGELMSLEMRAKGSGQGIAMSHLDLDVGTGKTHGWLEGKIDVPQDTYVIERHLRIGSDGRRRANKTVVLDGRRKTVRLQ